MKHNELMTKHPCVKALLNAIRMYPLYFILYSVYAHLLPVYNNAMYSHSYMSLSEDWIRAIAIIAAGPWLIITIISIITARNPFNKFSWFVEKHFLIIITITLYIPVASLMDAIYGAFLLPNHFALITAIIAMYIIVYAFYATRARKFRKVYYQYND